MVPVNDAPSFILHTNHSLQEHSVPHAESVPGFASASMWPGLFSGPPDEAGQTVTFLLAYHSGNATLFDVAPSVTSNGSLEFVAGAFQWGQVHPAPYTLHSAPYTLHPAPHTLHPPSLSVCLFLSP